MAGLTRFHGDISAGTGVTSVLQPRGEKSERGEPGGGEGDGRPPPTPPLDRTLTFFELPNTIAQDTRK